MNAIIIKEISERIKRKIKKIGVGLPLPQKRFLGDMLYGLLGSGESKLSSIARALQEGIPLGYTIKRLSRNLDYTELSVRINNQLVKEQVNGMEAEAIIAIDGSDISKPYASRMEYLHKVYDGSRKETSQGYQLFCMASIGKQSIKPLYGELYSTQAPDYRSHYDTVVRGLDMLAEEGAGKRALTIVADRGYDDVKFYRYYRRNKLNFITRLRTNRNFFVNNSNIARKVQDLYGYTKARRIDGEVIHQGLLKKSKLSISFLRGHIQGFEEQLTVVIVKSYLFAAPMYLLTNRRVDTFEGAYAVYKKYLKRWGVEQLYRLMKQKFNIEDFRLLKYRSMRNLFALVILAMALIGRIVYAVGNNSDITRRAVLKAAKRLRKDGAFLYYAIADGILSIIANVKAKPILFYKNYWKPPPLSLFDKTTGRKFG